MLSSAVTHATVAVSDLEKARAFYEGTLGLEVKEHRSDGVTYSTGAGTWFLIYPSQFAGTSKATSMTFEVGDIGAEVEELRGRGITFEEYDFPSLKTVNGIAEIQGVKGAWFKDPDGNIIAVAERT